MVRLGTGARRSRRLMSRLPSSPMLVAVSRYCGSSPDTRAPYVARASMPTSAASAPSTPTSTGVRPARPISRPPRTSSKRAHACAQPRSSQPSSPRQPTAPSAMSMTWWRLSATCEALPAEHGDARQPVGPRQRRARARRRRRRAAGRPAAAGAPSTPLGVGRRSPRRAIPSSTSGASCSSLAVQRASPTVAGTSAHSTVRPTGSGPVAVVLRLRQPGEGDVGVGHVVGVDVAVAVLVQRRGTRARAPGGLSGGVRRAGDHRRQRRSSGAVHSTRSRPRCARPSSSVTRAGQPGLDPSDDGARLDRRAGRRGGHGEAVDDLAVAEAGVEERAPRRPGATGDRGAAGRPPSFTAIRRRASSADSSVGRPPHSLVGHRAVERRQRRRTEAGPHELGVRVVARAARSGAGDRSAAMRAADAGGTVRSEIAGPQRERRPSARRGAAARCGGAPAGRRRAARRAGPAPPARADGCSRWLPVVDALAADLEAGRHAAERVDASSSAT